LSLEKLEQVAATVIRLAREAGATDAECTTAEGDEFETTVRLGEVEQIKEAGSRSAGVRVLFGKRVGSSYTSDLTDVGLRAMVAQAVDIASITTEDPFSGLPDPEELGSLKGDLQIFNDDVSRLDAAAKVDLARRAERAALDFDPRIKNSEGGSFGSSLSARAFANSRGFVGSYQSSGCSLSVSPLAQEGDSMERDYWYTAARGVAGLESPEQVGRIAAERAIRRLHARTVPTQKATVVFDPRMARTLIGHIFEAVHGESIYRKASFLTGKLGQKVASEQITIIDDATLPGLFGTSPFDDEGVPSRRTVVIENGVLKNYLLNSYTARKLGMKTTGNASRGLSGNAGIGHGNLFLQTAAGIPVADLLSQVRTGFYVTELMGQGFNGVTGDYSRGAAGLWIENGELTYAVQKVTIAGNLRDMLTNVAAFGNDLEFRSSVASPTLAIAEMTISGQ